MFDLINRLCASLSKETTWSNGSSSISNDDRRIDLSCTHTHTNTCTCTRLAWHPWPSWAKKQMESNQKALSSISASTLLLFNSTRANRCESEWWANQCKKRAAKEKMERRPQCHRILCLSPFHFYTCFHSTRYHQVSCSFDWFDLRSLRIQSRPKSGQCKRTQPNFSLQNDMSVNRNGKNCVM